MDQNRRYLGMTIQQIGILAGLAGALLLILCLGGFIVFRSGLNPPGLSQQPTIESTPSLIVSPTPTFTPAPTLIPYEQLIPEGWTQHLSSLAEIWMPPAYRDAKLKIPKGAVWVAQPDLVVSQPVSKSALYAKSMVISYEPLTDNLDPFVDVKVQSVSPSARLVDRGRTTLNTGEAIKLVFETQVDTLAVNQLVYVIQDGGTVWYVLYMAQINEFYENIETFDDSIRTFRLIK